MKAGRKTILIVLPILLAAIAGRILYLGELKKNPGYRGPGIDGAYHLYWARGLATGTWTVPEGRDDPEIFRFPFYRPPAYPYLLSLVFRLAGTGPLAPRLVQMLLGVAAALLLGRLGRSWFGFPAGLAAGLGAATYWTFLYYEGELLGVSCTVLLTAVLLALLARTGLSGGGAPALFSGLVLGTYALFRPNVLLFFPVAAGWLLVVSPRRWAAPGLLLAGILLALVPSAWRNYKISGEFVPIGTNLGISIAVANNPDSRGTTHTIPGLGEIGTPFDWPRLVRTLERQQAMEPGSLSHRAAANLLTGRALGWIRDHPGAFLRLLGRKALFFWGPREVRNIRELELERRHSRLLSRLPLSWSSVLALGLAGFVLVFLDFRKGSWARRYAVLAGSFILAYFLSVWPFAVAARYRVPVVPALLLLGGAAISRLVRLLRRREWGPLSRRVGAVVVLGLFFSLDFTGYEISPEKWHADRGLSFFAAGEYDRAAAEFEEAALVAPGYAEGLINLGAAYRKLGRNDQAISAYRRALNFKESGRARSNLAESLLAAGRIPEALREYRLALADEPDYTRIRTEYARALEQSGRREEAESQYRTVLSVDSGNIAVRLSLGVLLAQTGRAAEAAEQFRLVLELEPGNRAARHNLARLESER